MGKRRRRHREATFPASPAELERALRARREELDERRSARTRRRPLWLILSAVAGLSAAGLMLRPAALPANRPLAAAPAPAARSFDRDAAWKDLLRQVEFGPRVPNSPGHARCRDWLVESLKASTASVERQDFSRSLGGTTLRMSNILARFPAAGGRKDGGILLAAHWDTRPTADYEWDPVARRTPIPGANDGASGVAVLLELARVFRRNPPPVPVWIVLFDGEDYGPGVDRMFLGSRHFAASLPADCPRRGVLLDMVGDRDLRIPQEGYSRRNAPEVLEEVYDAAHRAGHGTHFPRTPGQEIEDDHLPLQRKGVRMIDLIDFEYGPGHSWWHTLEDTPDKCSADSLKAVGESVAEWVYTRR